MKLTILSNKTKLLCTLSGLLLLSLPLQSFAADACAEKQGCERDICGLQYKIRDAQKFGHHEKADHLQDVLKQVESTCTPQAAPAKNATTNLGNGTSNYQNDINHALAGVTNGIADTGAYFLRGKQSRQQITTRIGHELQNAQRNLQNAGNSITAEANKTLNHINGSQANAANVSAVERDNLVKELADASATLQMDQKDLENGMNLLAKRTNVSSLHDDYQNLMDEIASQTQRIDNLQLQAQSLKG